MRDPLATALCALFFVMFSIGAVLCLYLGACLHGVMLAALGVVMITGASHFAEPTE